MAHLVIASYQAPVAAFLVDGLSLRQTGISELLLHAGIASGEASGQKLGATTRTRDNIPPVRGF
jgi:hypothetical protein